MFYLYKKHMLLSSILLLFSLISCDQQKGKVSSLAKASLGVKVLSGENQIVQPNQTMSEEVVFGFKDDAGNPLVDSEVKFRLLDTTDIANLTIEDIKVAVEKNSDSLTLSDNGDLINESVKKPEENLGTLSNSVVRTDAKGVARVRVKAPKKYDRRITIVALAGEPDDPFFTVSYAHFTTTRFGQNEALILTTTNLLNETSGKPFELRVAIKEQDEVVDYISDKEYTLKLSIFPDKNQITSIPEGNITCSFESGRCLIPGGPFAIYGSGNLRLSVEVIGINLGVYEDVIKVTQAGPDQLAVSSNPLNESSTDACPDLKEKGDSNQPCLVFSADRDKVTFRSFAADKEGYIVNSEAAQWEITGPLAGTTQESEEALSFSARPEIELSLYRTGKGFIKLSHQELGLEKIYSYEIVAGRPAYYTVQSEHGEKESAVEHFAALLNLYDRKDNPANQFNGAFNIKFQLKGAGISPEPVLKNPEISFDEQVDFSAGIGKSSAGFLAPRSGDTVQLEVNGDLGLAKSKDVKIISGPVLSTVLRSLPDGKGDIISDEISMRPDENRIFYLAGTDKYGNYATSVAAKWNLQNFSTEQMVLKQEGDGSYVNASARSGGSGLLVASPLMPELGLQSVKITVESGIPVSLQIDTSGQLQEIAGEPFNIKVITRDLRGKIANNFNEKIPLTFSYTNPGPSWTGKDSILPSGKIDCQFSQGVCQLPVPDGTSGYVINNSEKEVILSVKDMSGKILQTSEQGEANSFTIIVKRGDSHSVVFANKSGGPAAGATILDLNKIYLSVDDTLYLSPSTVDKGGNYTGTSNVSWSASSSEISDYFSYPNSGSSDLKFEPLKIIAESDNATITAAVSGGGAPLSFQVVVRGGKTDHIDYTFDGGTSFKPGDCKSPTITLKDRGGNPITDISSEIPISIALGSLVAPPESPYSIVGPWGRKLKRSPTLSLRFKDGFFFPSSQYPELGDEHSAMTRVSFCTSPGACGTKFDYSKVFSSLGGEYSSVSWLHEGALISNISSTGTIQLPEICIANSQISPVLYVQIPEMTTDWGSHFGGQTIYSKVTEKIQLSVSPGPESFISFHQPDTSNPNVAGQRYCHDSFLASTKDGRFHDEVYYQRCIGRYFNGPSVDDDKTFTFFANITDAGGNALRPASGSWSIDPMVNGVTIVENTPQKLSFKTTNAQPTYNIQFTDSSSGISEKMAMYVLPGHPSKLVPTVLNTLQATSPFDLQIDLFDQFGNHYGLLPYIDDEAPMATCLDRYGSHNIVTVTSDASASPKGTLPFGPAEININEICYNKGHYGGSQTGQAFFHPKAQTPSTLTLTMDSLPEPGKTYNLHVTRTVGALQEAGTFLTNDFSGAKAPSDWTITTDNDGVKLYIIGRDSEHNTGPNKSAIVSVTGKLTEAPDQYHHESASGILTLTPSILGDSTITVHHQGTFQDDVINLTVTEGEIDHFGFSLVGIPDNQMEAGVPASLMISAFDKDENKIKGFSGQKFLQVSSNIQPNAENRTFDGFSAGNYSFLEGDLVTAISMTPYAATDNGKITVTYDNGSLIASVFSFVINPSSFHHYGVVSDNTYTPTHDLQSSFSSRIWMRDSSGNNLTSGISDPVSLKLVRSDDTVAPGSLSGTTSGISLSSGTANISNLKYDGVGTYKVKVSGGSPGAVDLTQASVITEINMLPSLAAINTFDVTLQSNPSTLKAGSPFIVDIRAVDNYGNTVAADSALNNLNLVWSGPGKAANGTEPIYTPTGSFINGVQSWSITPVVPEVIAAGGLTLDAKSGGSTVVSAALSSSLNIRSGIPHTYIISPSTTSLTADNQPSGIFGLNIKCKDQYENLCEGESGLTLAAQWISGSALTPGSIYGLPSSLDLSSGDLNLSGLHYHVAHQARLILNGTSAIIASPDMTFTATEKTIASYGLSASALKVGPGLAPVTVRALDQAGNLINHPLIDAALNSYTFCWTGFEASPAPSSTAAFADSGAVFSAGSGVFTHSLYKASTMPVNSVTVQDNFGGSCGSGHSGKNKTALTVAAGDLAKYGINDAFQLNQTAGSTFSLDIAAKDTWDNTISDYTGENLSFSWKGTTPSLKQSMNPETDSSGPKTFVNGVWHSPAIFRMFNTADPSPELEINGSSSGIVSSIKNFNLQAASTVDALAITSQNINYTWGVGALDTHTMSIDETLKLYALAYDPWGNVIGTTSVDWSSSENDLASQLSPSSGTSSTLSPVKTVTGVITATHTASGVSDSTGTITVTPGGLHHFKIEPQVSSPVVAGQPFQVLVTAMDAQENPVTSLNGNQSGSFSWNIASPSPGGNTPTVQTSDCTFSSGVCTTAADFRLFKDGESGIILNYISGGFSGLSSSPLTVVHASLNQLSVSPGSGYSVTAGDALNFQIIAKDAYGNPTTTIPNLDLSYTWQNTSPTLSSYGAGNGLTATTEVAGTKTFGTSGTYLTSSAFMLYNAYDDDSGAKPKLKVSSSSPAISAYSGEFSIAPLSSTQYVRIHSSSSSPVHGGESSQIENESINADQSLSLKLYGFDQFGNARGLQQGNWSANGSFNGKLSGSTSNSSSVTLPGSAGVGSGVVTAKLASDEAILDTTGTLSINPGAEASYEVIFTTSSPVRAGSGIGVTVTALDQYGQVVTSLNETRNNSSAFTWIGAHNAPGGTAPKTAPSCTFINGVCTITEASSTLVLYNGSDTGVHLKYTYNGKTGQTSSGALSVEYKDEVNNFLIVPASASVSAGVGFNVQIQARDAWNNLIAKDQSIDLTYQWKNTSPTSVGSVSPDVLPAGAAVFSGGIHSTSGSAFKLYNVADTTPFLQVTDTGSSASGSSATFTVSPSAIVAGIAVVTDNGGSYQELDTHTMNAAQSLLVYAEGRDPWGNPNGLQLADWSASGDHNGHLSSVTGSQSTQLSGSIGTGTITTKYASNPSITDQSGQISVAAGPFSITGDFAQNNHVSQSGTPTFSWAASAGSPLFDLRVTAAPGCSGGSTLMSASSISSASGGAENSYTVQAVDQLPDGGPYYLCITANGVNGSGDTFQSNDPAPAFYVESTVVHLLTRSLSSGSGEHRIDYFTNNFNILSGSDQEPVEVQNSSQDWFLNSVGLSLDSSNIPHISFARFNNQAYSMIYGSRTGGTFSGHLTDLYTGTLDYLAPTSAEETGKYSNIMIDHNNSNKVYIAHKNHRVNASPTDLMSVMIDEGGGSILSSVEAMDRINVYDTDLDIYDISSALDSAGNRHAAWVVKDLSNSGRYRLMYRKTGDASAQEITSGQCLDIIKVDLAIDKNDQAHVAYICKNKFFASTCTLAYKKQIGGVWDDTTEASVKDVVPGASVCNLTTVAESNDLYKPSLITDENNCPHVSSVYISSGESYVGYAKQSFSSGCQAFSAMENPAAAKGGHARIALDKFGYAYIAAISPDASSSVFVLSNNPSPKGGWILSGSDSTLIDGASAISALQINDMKGKNNTIP